MQTTRTWKRRLHQTLLSILLLTGSAAMSAAELKVQVIDENDVPVNDTIVELVGERVESAVAEQVEITQLDKAFTPEISVVSRGSMVLFSNKDPFQHHVYSVSPGNQFDLPLYRDTPSRLIQFDNNGIVKLGCNIHDWMLGFVYIAESSRLVVTDASGAASFSDLPAGEYQLRTWNPRLRNNREAITHTLSLGNNDSIEQSVTVSLRKTIRRPPKPRKNADYGDYES